MANLLPYIHRIQTEARDRQLCNQMCSLEGLAQRLRHEFHLSDLLGNPLSHPVTKEEISRSRGNLGYDINAVHSKKNVVGVALTLNPTIKPWNLDELMSL